MPDSVSTLGMAGVEYRQPPPNLLESALRIVREQTASLPPEKQGGIVAVATDVGINGAIVHRVGESFQVGAWIGKDWGSQVLQGGGYVKASW